MFEFDPYDSQPADQWDERMQPLSSLDGENELYATFKLGLDFTAPDFSTVDVVEEEALEKFQDNWELDYEISNISIVFEEEPTQSEDSEEGSSNLCWSGELHLTIAIDDDSQENRDSVMEAILDINLPDDMTISRID